MNKERFIEETAKYGLTALGLYAIATLSFTKSQRDWIDERDNHQCQAPWEHECNGLTQAKRHKHHIIPQRYAERMGIDPDYPENGISICENAHVGNGHETGDVIHPDMRQARLEYRLGNKEAYVEAIRRREGILDRRQIYWNDTYDRVLQTIAIRNTQRFKKLFPGGKKK